MTVFLRGKNHLTSRFKNLTTLQRINHCHNHALFEGGLQTQIFPEISSDFVARQSHIVDMPKWKKVSTRLLGIQRSVIPAAPWTVLKLLRCEGFEAYLVGGCVRDMILNRVPKDFDVITTASLKEIKKKFYRCAIIGRRFPICVVNVKGSVVEVSSFSTTAKKDEEKEKVLLSQMPESCDKKDFLRWRNSMQRDFTVNSLFFDPFKNQIYDYANGILDLRSLKLRTLIPAQLSFEEDCARILRGLRIAGRLGLSISKDIETAIYKLSSSVFNLSQARIMMELTYMLSYGAAESTIYLLQRFKLLEKFLPFHAAYLDQQADKNYVQSSTMLMKLFSNLDKMLSTDRPCDCSLWLGLLAFHQALVIKPQDAYVIWTFASVLYCGTWKEGVKFARENAKMLARFEPEISRFSEFKSDEELAEEVSQLVSLIQDAADALVDPSSLKKSMSRYPDSTCPCCVFVPKKTGNHVAQLVNVLANDAESDENRRERFMMDYNLLGKGDLLETRFALGKVILETLSSCFLEEGMESIKKEPLAIEQNCTALPDLVENSVLCEKDQKHNLFLFDPKPKRDAKRQKRVTLNFISEREMHKEKGDVALKYESQVMDSKLLKVVKESQLHNEVLNVMQGEHFREGKSFHCNGR